ATVAKVIDRFEDEATDDILPVGNIRKRASASLLEADKRYSGKATSRKALQEELWGDALSEEGSAEEALDDWYSGSEGSEEEDSVGTKGREKPSSAGSEQEDDLEDDEEAKAPKFSSQNITDFEKFTEGMDDAGSSEGEDENEDEDDADMEEGNEEEEEEEFGSENHDDGKETKDSEDDGGVLTFSRRQESEEVEKGKAVRNQLALWDQLMEGRIKMQKVLMTANRLPQPDTYPRFRKEGGQDFDNAVENC
ncbi:AATF protein, partial [Vidua macroura]|nr:AATF protein [Vidua chalybeata]NXQ07142.1 AATF protein [Vidua macroura]